jgi:hypothetical protein
MGIRQTIETAIKQEAFTLGEVKGKTEGKKEDSFGMFDEGLTSEAVARITKLPLETIQVWKKEWETQK